MHINDMLHAHTYHKIYINDMLHAHKPTSDTKLIVLPFKVTTQMNKKYLFINTNLAKDSSNFTLPVY